MIACPKCNAEIDDDSIYCDQCGAALPRLTLKATALGFDIEAENDMLLGRKAGPYAAQFAGQKFVSGKHAQLHFQAVQGWCIEDLGSTNGTYIGADKLSPGLSYPLKNGQTVKIANVELKVESK